MMFRVSKLLILSPALLLFLFCSRKDLSRGDVILLKRIEVLYHAQKFAEAEVRLKKFVKTHESNVEARVLLAKINLYTGRSRESAALLKEGLKKDANNPYMLLWLGKAYLTQKSTLEEAKKTFRKILKRNPESLAGHYYLGVCFESEKKYKAAILQYRKALQAERRVSRIHSRMAALFHRLRLHERRDKHIERVRLLNVSRADIMTATALLRTLKKSPRGKSPASNGVESGK